MKIRKRNRVHNLCACMISILLIIALFAADVSALAAESPGMPSGNTSLPVIKTEDAGEEKVSDPDNHETSSAELPPRMLPGNGQITDIADVRELAAAGDEVTVRGVVTRVVPRRRDNPDNSMVFIQDETGALGIYKTNTFSPSSFAPGTTITATGIVRIGPSYNNDPFQTFYIEPAESGNVTAEPVEPMEITPRRIALNESVQKGNHGAFVRIDGLKITNVQGVNGNIEITATQDGVTVGANIRVTYSGESPNTEYTVGSIVDIQGISSYFMDGAYGRLLVCNLADIHPGLNVAASPDSGAVSRDTKISLFAAPGGVENVEGLVIRYSVNGGEEKIYTEPFSLPEFPAIVSAHATLGEITSPPRKDFVYYCVNENGVLPIADARKLTGTSRSMTVEGTVTRYYSGRQPFIQDDSGGIRVLSLPEAYPYPAGATLRVTGKISNIYGMPDIVPDGADSVVRIGDDTHERIPEVVSIADLLTGEYEGRFVKIEGAEITAKIGLQEVSQSSATIKLELNAPGNAHALDEYELHDAIDVVGVAIARYPNVMLLVEKPEDIRPGALGQQVKPVRANPPSGVVQPGDFITLSTDTEGARIRYSISSGNSADGGKTYQEYTGPIEIRELPCTILAYAMKASFVDSDASMFRYKEESSGQYNTYFGQLHSHTTLSDGMGSIQEAFDYASKANNIDFLAVTDHSNSFDDSQSASMWGSNGRSWTLGHDTAEQYTTDDFVGLYGFEMTWGDGTGHINTYNTPGYESRNNSKFMVKGEGLRTYYDILKQFPASISQFNHPGDTFGRFMDYGYHDSEIDKVVNLIEVGNGEGPIHMVRAGYWPSYEEYTRALDKGWHVAPSNNQDNHKGKWGNSNTCRTVVLAEELTREDIYDAIRDRRVYATEDHNLEISYDLNNKIMGSTIPDRPEQVDIRVQLRDPDNEGLGTVSVIVNGGITLASRELEANGEGEVIFEGLSPEYSYYYIRVDQEDTNIAVTAPVWVGSETEIGIKSTASSMEIPLKGKEVTISSELYNNEAETFTVDSLTYSIDGEVIHEADISYLSPQSDSTYSFVYTFGSVGKHRINVQMTGTYKGTQKVLNDVLEVEVAEPRLTTQVVVDATHSNDYVTGYLRDSVKEFVRLASGRNISVNIERGGLTDEVLKDAQLLVVTPPAKKSEYGTRSVFTEEELAVIGRYVARGGNLLLLGLTDYNDGQEIYQTSTQMNKIIDAIGAATRFNNDAVMDDVMHEGQPYHLAFDTYNDSSALTGGIEEGLPYTFPNGCSLDIDSEALSSGRVTWLVKGHETTYSKDSNSYLPGVSLPNGSVYALAEEQLSGGGRMVIGGSILISDPDMSMEYSNHIIVGNILDSVGKELSTTPISEIRKAPQGEMFAAEGIVTAGTMPGNAFFDTIYIQDETGGITLFPVSQEGIRVGQRVRVTGTVDEYQGDLELSVTNLEVTDPSIHPVEPTSLSARDAMDSSNGGLLVWVSGRVTKVNMVGNTVSEIFLDDGSGTEARVFLDGYIGYSDETDPKLEDIVTVGATVNAAGLASMDTEGARIRVRDRSEITVTDEPIVDKTALESMISSAQDIYDVAEVGSETGQYPQEAYDAFGDAINAAKAVRDNPDVTQEEIDDTVEALRDALRIFEGAVIPDPTAVNRAGITVEPVTVIGKDRTVTFRISAENLRDVWTMEGTVKIEDTEHFEIASVRSPYEQDNTVFQSNIGRYGEGTAYFILARVGGFADTEKAEIAEVRIRLKEGASASSLEAFLDSIQMYRGIPEDHTAVEIVSEIAKGSAVTQIHEEGIPGDLNGDGNVTALDLAISLTCFGLTSDDAKWYTSGAWKADFDGNGVIDITDISTLAWRLVHGLR